jgi:hypothetical protein
VAVARRQLGLAVLIGIAFLLSGVSGLVFLAPATDSGNG